MTRSVLMAAAAVATGIVPFTAVEPADELLPGQVVTIAGTGALGTSPDGTPALEAELHDDMGVAVAPDGTVYVADTSDDRVRTVGADRLLGSVPELSGGESADGESYTHLWAVAAGADGSLYAATDDGIGVRRPDGAVETIAGGFIAQDIAVGADGTVYVADLPNNQILAVDPAGTATTIAGADGTVGEPRTITVDSTGTVYFTDTTTVADERPTVVRRIDPDGTVSTVVGDEGAGFAGDGGPAEKAQVSDHLGGLAVGDDDTLYLADTGNAVVRAIGADGVITTVGPVLPSDPFLGGQAPAIPAVEDVAVGPDGYLYVGLSGIVRMIVPGEAASIVGGTEAEDRQAAGEDPWADESPGTVVTVAGAEGELKRPWRVAVDETGGVYVVEQESRRLLRLDADGKPEPVRGGIDGEPLAGVRAVAPGAGGAVHVSTDVGVDTVYPDGSMVRLAAGVQRSGQTVADGVPATTVAMANWDLTLGPAGLYVVDASEQRVYAIAPDGTLTTAASEVDAQYAGGVGVADDGTLYVAENRLDQVTEISPDGTATVIAGNGESGWINDEIGDGGPATEAVLARPTDVAVDTDGTLYVSSSSHGIRRIDTDGTISTIFDGEDEDEDEGSTGAAPTSMDFDSHGNLYFAEPDTGLVRVLVRPGEMAGPFPWGVAMGAGGVLAVAGAVLVWRRRRAGGARVSTPI